MIRIRKNEEMKKQKIVEQDRYGFWIEPNGTIHIPEGQWRVEQSELGTHIFPLPRRF
jgi:hypothetical protein